MMSLFWSILDNHFKCQELNGMSKMEEVLEVEKKVNFLQHDIIGIMVMLSMTNNTSMSTCIRRKRMGNIFSAIFYCKVTILRS